MLTVGHDWIPQNQDQIIGVPRASILTVPLRATEGQFLPQHHADLFHIVSSDRTGEAGFRSKNREQVVTFVQRDFSGSIPAVSISPDGPEPCRFSLHVQFMAQHQLVDRHFRSPIRRAGLESGARPLWALLPDLGRGPLIDLDSFRI